MYQQYFSDQSVQNLLGNSLSRHNVKGVRNAIKALCTQNSEPEKDILK